jgi:hypothetical protein
LKFADKWDNLSDSAFQTKSIDVSETQKIKRKKESILRTVPTYRLLWKYHKLDTLMAEFEQLVTNFRSVSTLSNGAG